MKISFRLLLLLIFLALILPFMLPHLGYRSAQKIDEKYQEVERNYENQVAAKRSRFAAEIDSLGYMDGALKKCILAELSTYTRMLSGSSGAIKSAFALKTLRCEGMGIRDIDGLGSFTELRHLSLARNDIGSLIPIRHHPTLTSIDLTDNANLEWLDSLETMYELRNIRFPNLQPDQCAIAQEVVDAIKARHAGRTGSNIRSACR